MNQILLLYSYWSQKQEKEEPKQLFDDENESDNEEIDTLKTVGQIDEDSDDGIMADDFDEPDETDSGNKNILQISAFCLLKK